MMMIVNGGMIRNEQGEQFRKPSTSSAAAAACSSHSNDTIQEREKILMKWMGCIVSFCCKIILVHSLIDWSLKILVINFFAENLFFDGEKGNFGGKIMMLPHLCLFPLFRECTSAYFLPLLHNGGKSRYFSGDAAAPLLTSSFSRMHLCLLPLFFEKGGRFGKGGTLTKGENVHTKSTRDWGVKRCQSALRHNFNDSQLIFLTWFPPTSIPNLENVSSSKMLQPFKHSNTIPKSIHLEFEREYERPHWDNGPPLDLTE